MEMSELRQRRAIITVTGIVIIVTSSPQSYLLFVPDNNYFLFTYDQSWPKRRYLR